MQHPRDRTPQIAAAQPLGRSSSRGAWTLRVRCPRERDRGSCQTVGGAGAALMTMRPRVETKRRGGNRSLRLGWAREVITKDMFERFARGGGARGR